MGQKPDLREGLLECTAPSKFEQLANEGLAQGSKKRGALKDSIILVAIIFGPNLCCDSGSPSR